MWCPFAVRTFIEIDQFRTYTLRASILRGWAMKYVPGIQPPWAPKWAPPWAPGPATDRAADDGIDLTWIFDAPSPAAAFRNRFSFQSGQHGVWSRREAGSTLTDGTGPSPNNALPSIPDYAVALRLSPYYVHPGGGAALPPRYRARVDQAPRAVGIESRHQGRVSLNG